MKYIPVAAVMPRCFCFGCVNDGSRRLSSVANDRKRLSEWLILSGRDEEACRRARANPHSVRFCKNHFENDRPESDPIIQNWRNKAFNFEDPPDQRKPRQRSNSSPNPGRFIYI